MAANFQPQMNNGGQMMMQQQQRGQQPPQRPQQVNMVSAQIQQLIFTSLQENTGPLDGWQASVLIQERMGMVFNLVGNLRLASQSQQNGPTIHKMIEIGLKFEKEIFERSPDREHYKHEIQVKLDQLLERRSQNMQGLQQSINDQARAQAQAQQAAAQQQMMNQNGMQGQMTRPQPAQQGFHHLQHQMTASPIPGQGNQQPGGGLPNQGMPQNMTPSQQQQFQMSMQQQGQQNPQNGLGRPQNNGQQPGQQQSQQDAMVNQLGHKLMAQATEQERNQVRLNLQSRMDAAILQGYAAKGIDPLFLYYRNQALQRIGAQRRQQQQQQQQQQQAQQAQQAQAQAIITQQQAQNIPATAPAMQQQRSTNRSPMNGQAQPPVSTGGNADFFMGNMIDQQQQGVMAEQAGQTVVPMSNAQRNATPQPGLMANQQMNMNDQRAAGNPNITAQQRQQLFNAQQQRAQQQQAAQAQQQQTARANTQAKAQQIALQGQIGGMGPGPMPHQPSPAMSTLNAPLTRAPGQMNQPEAVHQLNPNAQFGQPLDPRFAQANQRAQMNASIIATMPQELQNKLSTFPPERVNEVVLQYHQRQRQQQQQNAQAGRAQIPMQGNNQMRPGPQVPQEGQFNPQNALGQFMIANPGRPPPAQLINGMSPQQQLLLQQQIGRMNPNHLQQRNANGVPMTPQAAQHMDQMDIPQQALAHPTMPRNIPQEIKKWGALKNWVQQSGGLAPDSLGNVINLQKAHYNQQLRVRNVANQLSAGGMPGGGPGVPATLPPGIAPMAIMGNHIQMPGMNMSQPGVPQISAQDIQNARITNPQLANASDDQIRNQIIRNRYSSHQQQQQRQTQMMQQQQLQLAQLAQLNNQQHRPGIPGQLQPPGGQNVPGQMQQPKQPPQVIDSAPPVANRANRPTPVGRGIPPSSASVEPPKNSLKRQSSEDVVEVPNPNSMMPQRTTPQQNTGLKGPPQAATAQPSRPQQLTPEQIQKLDPEARKKYEHSIRMFQQSQQNSNPASSLIAKLRQIASEENARGQNNPMPDLPMDPTMKASIQASLPMVVKPLKGMTSAIGKWYEATHDDARARNFFRMSYRIRKQYHDEGQYQQMKDTFSITPTEIEAARRVLVTMIGDLSNMMPGKMKRSDASQPDSATTSTPPQAGPAPIIPLNAANLQQQQKQLMNHQKAPSRSSNAPAAPTSTQPPFLFGAQSPHGTPAYGNGKQSVTQADLKIPPRKRPKTGNNVSAESGTPGSMASPTLNKTVSPELKRQNIADTKQQAQARPMLCCSEPDCDRHKVGFENEEALKLHREEEHIKPLSNPLKYAQENLAAVLGLDSEGHPKTSPSGEKMVQSESRQGQTPNIKAGTPMSRQDSMIRQASSTGKPSTKPQTETGKAPAVSQPAVLADPWANTTIDPQELFATFQGFETSAGGGISDMNVYRSITPNESPESNSTAVTDTSDISDGVNLDISLDLSFDESWMPFGGSDVNGLADLNNFDFGNEDMSFPLEDDLPMANYMSWDDTQQEFNKPFEFDTSMYLMNPGQ